MDETGDEMQRYIVMELAGTEHISDAELYRKIDEVIQRESVKTHFSLNRRLQYRQELFYAIRGLDLIDELLENPSVTEIMINGHKDIFIEENGRIRKYGKQFSSENRLNDIIQKMISDANRVVNETTPIADARLKDGSRMNVVLPPISLNGPSVTIRKFPEQFTMPQLIEKGTLTEECAEFLKKLVRSRYNIFISGGTGAGKTTFLNSLAAYIPAGERIITIEDSAELQLAVPDLVRMEVRYSNMEGKNEIRIRDLIRAALRMRPDRIIVGEVRSEEAIDMLQAMNTGHDGSISTGHANSSEDMLLRLETMILMSGSSGMPLEAIRAQIASAIDILIHLERFRDGSRKVVSVEEIIEYQEGKIKTQELFTFDRTKETLLRSDHRLVHTKKLQKAEL